MGATISPGGEAHVYRGLPAAQPLAGMPRKARNFLIPVMRACLRAQRGTISCQGMTTRKTDRDRAKARSVRGRASRQG